MRSAAALVVLLAAGVAAAGSRPAVTNGLYFRPGDPHSYYVRSTFGLLVSHDDACTFTWLCEDNLGFGGTWDPRVAIARDGTIFAGMYNALRVSRDDGCTFTTNASLPPNTWVDAIDIGPTGEVWVGTATSGGSNDLYASTDGETFASRHQHSSEVWWKSVRVARSDARRVYAAGYQVAPQPRAHVVRTDDGGEHWVESPLAGVVYGPTPVLIVAAIDPAKPEIAYVVSTGANKGVGDILYRTSDGGQTLAPVLTVQGGIGDVVVKDADTVIATTLVQQGIAMAGGTVYASHDGGATFAPLTGTTPLTCIAQRGDSSLVGCGGASPALATSGDAGKTWQPLWQLAQLAGARSCAAGTAEHDTCGAKRWTALAKQIGATGPTCTGSGHADDIHVPAPTKKSGSCNAGAGSAGLLVGLLALGLRRKR